MCFFRSRLIELIRNKNNGDNFSEKNQLVTFLNPYSYLIARKNINVFSRFDCIYYDGILLVILLKLARIRSVRVSFDMTSLAPIVFESADEAGNDIYFIGGEPGVAEEATRNLNCMFPKMKINGVRHGFFSSTEERLLSIANIVEKQPSIVIVGMGSPLQEKFLLDLRAAGWEGTGYTCGGFLHQTASKGTQYYPKLMNRLNLRWLYRMIDEPKLVRRYFVDYPKFLVVFLFDLICYYISKIAKIAKS